MKMKRYKFPDYLWMGIRFLIEPPPDITDIQQRRQARLLSALLLIIILLGSISGVAQLFMIPGFFPAFIVIAGAIVILCIAYILTRTRHYLVATTLASLTPSIASYVVLLSSPNEQPAFVFMLISVLLGSILLNRWFTVGIAILNLLGLILLPALQPAWAYSNLAGPISYHVVIPALILIAMWHRDLLERDRRRELVASELKFRSIFDNSVDAIGVSKVGIHVMANPAYVSMFGYESAEQIVGKPILDLIAPTHRRQILNFVQRRAAGESSPINYETRGLRCDGTEFDMEVYVSTYEIGGEIYTVPILRDISERKRVEKELSQFKFTLDKTSDCVFMFEPETLKFFYVNQGALEQLGYTEAELLQLHPYDIKPEFSEPHFRTLIVPLLDGTRSEILFETIHRHKTGRDIPVEISLQFITPNGKDGRFIAIVRDVTERRRVEESLRISEKRFRDAMDAVSDGLWDWDTSTGTVYYSPSYFRMLGYEPGELPGTLDTWLALIHPEDRARALENNNACLRNETQAIHVEFRMQARDGSWRWILGRGRAVQRDVQGQALQIIGTHMDITERKQVEEDLRTSEEKFSKAFHSSPDSVTLSELETGRLIEVNDGFQKVFGYSREEAIGRTTLELGLYKNPSDRTQMMQMLREQGNIRNLELTGSHKSGSELAAMLSVEQIEIKGKPCLVTITRDITEQIMAQKAVQESELRFREMLRGVDLAGVMLDRSGRISFINDFLSQLTGWLPEEALGKDWFDNFLPPEIREYIRTSHRQLITEEHIPSQFENEIISRDGQRRLFRWSNTMLFDLNGHVTGTASIGDDITERKFAEEEREKLITELEAKNSELERFTYTVSHDLKSPLVTIKGFLGFLKRDITSGNMERFTSDLERIGNATKKMEQLLRDLLELSRIGRMLNPMENISFEDLVRDAMDIVHGQMEARGVTVHVQPNLPAVYGDHQRLTEVLQNLLDNAAKYMGNQEKPHIEIGLRGLEGRKFIFFVRDNGIGIASEHHERIFGLFNKLDVTSEGTGVGLALVKRIIEFHGGRIWVESDGNGRGATFYFSLQDPLGTDHEEKIDA